MARKRQTDSDAMQPWPRAKSRIFEKGKHWYFYTREGTVEGPYDDKKSAERFLESYVQVMGSKFVPSMELKLMDDTENTARSADLPDLGIGRFVRGR